jgi:riboflavin kinase, archaea type
LETLIFKGKVVTGEGNGKKYLSLYWVKQQIQEKLGFSPYLGTLNLKLSKEGMREKRILAETKTESICPAEGYCLGLLFKAQIDEELCAVIIPKVKNYPENILEIIAASNLREKLKLKDGVIVSVSVFV